MDKIVIFTIVFTFFDLLGFYLAYLYGRKTKNFRWREYLAIVAVPLGCVFAAAYLIDLKIINLFLVSCFIGFALEYLLGLAYHKTLNKRLWEYKRLSVHGYTSLLSIPFWGVGGVSFWFIAKILGL